MPPDSPDLNPIEQVFAKLKRLLRKAARSRAGLWAEIGQALETFSPEEYQSYLASAGYEPV